MFLYSEKIKNKYPAKMLAEREFPETQVISCLREDLTLLDDYELKENDFLSIEYRIMWNIIKKLKEEGYQSASLMEIKSRLSEPEKQFFKDENIWSVLNDGASLIEVDKFKSYLDTLYKNNIYTTLHKLGFDLFKEVTYNKKTFVPFELFRNMTSNEVKEFYEYQINNFGTVDTDKSIEENFITFDDDYINDIMEGKSVGTMFDQAGENIINQKIQGFPIMSKQSNGLLAGTLSCLAGYTNVGKSTYLVSMIMALVYRGEKVVLCSNEQKVKPFKDNFLMWVLVNKLNYKKLDKNKLRQGREAFSDEDLKMIKLARKIWDEEYQSKILFISIPSAKMEQVEKKFREHHLRSGYTTFIYDTFKLDFSNKKETFWLSLVEDSRRLAEFANRYAGNNVKVFATMQNALATEGQLWLTRNVLANAKQVVEVFQNLFIIRDMYQDEKLPDSKFYCKPYTVRYTMNKDGQRVKETIEYELDPNQVYKVVFLDKLREGKTSGSGNYAIVLKFDGEFGTMEEVCYCTPARKNINAG
nr:MAG TPA: replicative helicase [Caudoviricetes sp.]